MPNPTPRLGLTKPTIGDTTVWGTQLNTDLDLVDAGVEILSDKDQANGYAGLTAGGLLNASEFPAPSLTTFGGIKAINPVTHNFVSSIGLNGIPVLSQPTFADLASHPTTLGGYGITDALPSSTVLPQTIGAVTSNWLNSYNATTGLFTQTQPLASDISGLAAIATSGKWSDLRNATGVLTLANAGNATTFNQTSPANWTWANTTASGAPALFITSAVGSTGAGAVSVLNTTAFNLVAGNTCIVATDVVTPSGVPTDTAGNTYTLIYTGSRFRFYSVTNCLGNAANVVTMNSSGSASFWSVWALELSGYATFDVGVQGTGSGTSATAGPLTTTQAVEILLALEAVSGSTGIPSGFIQAPGNGAYAVNAYYQQLTSIDSGVTISATVGGGSWWLDVVAIKAAANTTPGNSSPILNLSGTLWTTSSVLDNWSIQNVIGNLVSNPTSTLTIAHTGATSGAATVQFLNSVVVANNILATGSVSQNSPGIGFNGQYWTGSASALDQWSIQNVVANGTNGASTLNFVHSGSAGGGNVSVPNLITAGNITLTTNGNKLQSASGAGGISFPNNSQVDFQLGGTDCVRFATTFNTFGQGIPITFSTGSPGAAGDVGLSRLNIASLAIGNGSAGDTTANLSFNKVIKYNGIATVSAGVPSEVATVDSTGLVASTGTVTLYAVPAAGAGQYRVSWNAKLTHTGTSPIIGPMTIIYTDPDGTVCTMIVAWSDSTGTTNSSGNSSNSTTSTGVLLGFTVLLNCSASTNIQYSFPVAGTVGAATWNLHIKCEAMG